MNNVKGTTLWAVVIISLGVLGSATYLAALHVIGGATISQLFILLLGAAGVTGAVHVTGQQIAANSKTGGTPEHPVYMKAADVIPTANVEQRDNTTTAGALPPAGQ